MAEYISPFDKRVRDRREYPPRPPRKKPDPNKPMEEDEPKNPVGAPKGSQNRLTHGIVLLRKQIYRKRRMGKDIIDHRTKSGQAAIQMREDMITERGGADKLSIAELTMIELIARDTYFLDEVDRRIFAAIRKLNEMGEADGRKRLKNPAHIARLYSYRQAPAKHLANNLQAMGLDKRQAVETLADILAEGNNDNSDDQPEESDES